MFTVESKKATTPKEEPFPTSSRVSDNSHDTLVDSIARIRLVQFQKDNDEPMGITLKVTEDGRCFVARIMHGGMVHRQASASSYAVKKRAVGNFAISG
ncbi:hypothetical protein COOONC_00883 [Cooperia oncophora]